MLNNEVQQILKEALTLKKLRIVRIASDKPMTQGEALKLKLDFQRYLSKDRKTNKKIYPESHPLHDATVYGFLTIGTKFIPRLNSWAVIVNGDQSTLEVYSVESAKTNEQMLEEEPKKYEEDKSIGEYEEYAPIEVEESNDFSTETMLGKDLF